VFQFELLERREQPNDMFGLGGSTLLGLESGFQMRDPEESALSSASELPLVSETPAAASAEGGTVLASPTDLSGSLETSVAPAPVSQSAQLLETVAAMSSAVPVAGNGPMSVFDMISNGPVGEVGVDGTWFTNPEIPIANGLSQTTTVADDNGNVYIVGGGIGAGPTSRVSDLRKYDPSTGEWSTLASIPYADGGSFYDAAVHVAGKIYVFGGVTVVGTTAQIFDKTWIYDIETNTWSEGATMPGPRFAPCVSEIAGFVFVSGGAGTAIHNDLWIYDTYKNTYYTGLPTMPAGATYRMHGAFTYFDNAGTLELQHHCFAGGLTPAAGNLHHVFDLNTFTWAARPNMPFPVTDPGVDATYNFNDFYHQTIYVSGGVGADAGKVRKYNVRTQTWSDGPSMPAATNNTSSALSNYFHLFVMGGFNGTTSVPVNYSFPGAFDV
jgi:hypothetical protein